MCDPPSQPPPLTRPRRAIGYDRARDLPRLLPVWPRDLEDASPAGRVRLIALLRRALRAERARGLAAHWTYDLARHAQLRAALDAELALAAETSADPLRACPRPKLNGASPYKKARY